MGGGAFVVGLDGHESEVVCGVGNVATVCDGEVAGMAGELASISRYGNGNRNGNGHGHGGENTHIGSLQSGHHGCKEGWQDRENEIPSFKVGGGRNWCQTSGDGEAGVGEGTHGHPWQRGSLR